MGVNHLVPTLCVELGAKLGATKTFVKLHANFTPFRGERPPNDQIHNYGAYHEIAIKGVPPGNVPYDVQGSSLGEYPSKGASAKTLALPPICTYMHDRAASSHERVAIRPRKHVTRAG
jgi:hypothetical protein